MLKDIRRKFRDNRSGSGWLKKIAIGAMALLLFSAAPLDSNAKQLIPKSKIFDLTAPGKELIRDKELYNGTVQQSFAFDNVNHHIYVVQLMAGGQQLPGEEAPVSGAKRSEQGDLTLTKLDMDGNILGHMFLTGFGHGVQIGVEVEGNTPYLWTETDSVTEGKDGWGTQLARFPFNNGAILTPDSSSIEKHQLIEGVDRTTVNIDPANELLTMRYREDGVFHFALFDLQQVKRNIYVPIADVLQPPMGTFQGFASYGGYLYTLEGNAFGNNGSVEPYGNTYITSVDWRTGEVVDRQLFTGGDSLTFREPEGMAIRIPNVKHPQKAQLSIGFASNFTPNRWGNIYYIDKLVPEKSLKR